MLVSYIPHPRDYVTIRENYLAGAVPYVVPVGKVFVLTALGTNGGPLFMTEPAPPPVLSAVFFPGMPGHAKWGDNGYDLYGGMVGTDGGTVVAGSRFHPNACTVSAVPQCCVYEAGTQIEVFGGSSYPGPSLDRDACAYGYTAPAH